MQAAAYARAIDPKFTEHASVSIAYPGLEGNELQTAVFTDFLKEPDTPNLRLALLDADGEPTLHRHRECNPRNYEAHRENLVRTVLKYGLHEGVSWRSMGCANHWQTRPLQLDISRHVGGSNL